MGNTIKQSECNMCTKERDLESKNNYCHECELYIHQEHNVWKNVKCDCGGNNDIKVCYHCDFAFESRKCRVCYMPLCEKCGKYNDWKDTYYCKTHFKN